MLEEIISFSIVGLCFVFLVINFRKCSTLYLNIYVAAIGCLFLGELYKLAYIFSFGSLPEVFNLKYLGVFGSFLFFASANFGVMDHIVDDGSAENRRLRIFSLVAPLIVIILFTLGIYFEKNMDLKFMYFMLMIPIAFSSYFSCKQILFSDMDLLFLKLVKPCNGMVLVLGVLNGVGILIQSMGSMGVNNIIMDYLKLFLCVVLTFFLVRSRKLWKI